MMIYTIIHLSLLLAATSGIWLVRRSRLLLVVGLLLFPLPAAFFNVFAAPVPEATSDRLDPRSRVGDCVNPAAVSDERSGTSSAGEGTSDVADDCKSLIPAPRTQALPAILALNISTVWIGVLAALICLKSVRRRQ